MSQETNISKFKDELDKLLLEGERLSLSLLLELDCFSEEQEEQVKKLELPEFKRNYEQWYTVSMQVIKQVVPDRFADFVKMYKDEKRKSIDALTYGVSDYMLGIKTRGGVDGSAAIPNLDQQINILKSARERIDSSLFDMVEVLQAELFDNELDAAQELAKKGFLRGAGAIAGVVLEGHLGHVCEKHDIKTRKKAPTINDFNEMLKNADVIDTPEWRKIQHLGDLRNLCDHKKDREPTKDEVNDLISGVARVIKTLF